MRERALWLAALLVACGEPASDPVAPVGGAGGGGQPSGAAGMTSSPSGGAGASAGIGVGGGGMAGAPNAGTGVGGGGMAGAPNAGMGGSAGTDVGGSGGSGGTGVYTPCPAPPEPCKIMPSGDSITVGAQSTETGGYRVPLFQTATKADKHFTFVGPAGAGPEKVDGLPFPDAHDGHSGYVIDTIGSRKGLLPLMAPNLTKLSPHIVLLMIGTNDINSQLEVAQAPERLAKILDVVTSKAPSTLLVVAQLIPTRTDSLNDQVRTYNDAVAKLVSERKDAGKHLALVDMYGAFTQTSDYKNALLFDGLHPNDAGYAVMAKVWYDAISGYLR